MRFWHWLWPDDPMREGECQASEDPAVEEGDDGEDEAPPDAAGAEAVVLGLSAADALHVVVVPAGGERQDADRHANACKEKLNFSFQDKSSQFYFWNAKGSK